MAVAIFMLILGLALFSFSLTIVEQIIDQINPKYQMTSLTQFLTSADTKIQGLAPYFLALIMVFSFCVPIYWIYCKLRRNRRNYPQLEANLAVLKELEGIHFNYKVILCIGVIAFILVEVYHHFRFNLPIGTDARIYLYQLETITLGANDIGAWRIISLLPTILTFSMFLPFRVAGVSWDSIIKFVPLILGALYLLTTFYFVKKCTNNRKIASLSTLFAALSLHTLALSTVLFRQLYSLSLSLLFLTFYVSYLIDRRRFFIYLCSVVLLLLCAQDAYAAIFLTITLILFSLLNLGRNFKNGITILKSSLKMYIPVPIAVLLLDLYNFHLYGRLEQPVSAFLPTIIQGSFSIKSLSPLLWITTFQQNWQSIFLENTYILVFSLIGIIALLYSTRYAGERQFYFASLLLCWITSVSLMMSIANLQEAYRFVLYYPMPIVAAIGFLFAVERASSHLKHHQSHLFAKLGHNSKKCWLSTKYLILTLLCLILLNGALVRLDSGRYFLPYSLPSEELGALQWIREQYGAQNTIFIMKPPGWCNNQSVPYYWQWAAYFFLPDIGNISIYVGTLSSLFLGNPSQQLPSMIERPSYSREVLSDYSILLIDSRRIGTYYYRDLVEESILVPVHPIVYQVKNLSLQEIEDWNTTWDTFAKTDRIAPKEIAFEDFSFDSEWIPCRGFLATNGTVAELALADGQTAMWIDRTGLSINSSHYRFLEIETDPHGSNIAIDFYGSNGEVLGRYWRFHPWNGSRILHLKINDIVSGKTISRIAINFMGYNATSSCNIYSLKIFSL